MKNKLLKQIRLLNASQKKGALLLIGLIILLQVSFYFYRNRSHSFSDIEMNDEQVAYVQQQIDSLKTKAAVVKIYPFNPNFITEAKGYRLEMSLTEIDKLLAFRKVNRYVNSVKEFQQITQVSDAWIEKYSPYFSFPAWTQNQNKTTSRDSGAPSYPVKDINKASHDDLTLIKGIGAAYADRILKERERFGGFVHMDQVKFIWNLPPEVIASLQKYFRVSTKPNIAKVNVNSASKEDLAKIPYLNYQVSRELLIYRSKTDNPLNVEDMKKIKGFPLDKLNIIALYLDF